MARLPPKGYSIPMGPTSEAQVQCQKCGSKSHWTYECSNSSAASSSTKRSAAVGGAKLSRTQMLRLGIQKPLQAVAPPKSEREVYDEQLKEAEAQLLRDTNREEKQVRKRQRADEEPSPTSSTPIPGAVAPNRDEGEGNPLDNI